MSSFAKQALSEYNGEIAMHHGGIKGRPYWNVNSSQFTYNPKLQFPIIPGAKEYLYTATDKNGKTYSFKSATSTSLLTPIWKDLPTGMVTLRVESLDENGNANYLSGVRTFFKCDPFPGRENLPDKDYSYRECALKAYRYLYNHSMVQYLLKNGTPDPDYDYNIYASKTLGSIIYAMVTYSKLEPENGKNALDIAKKAADYLISISYGDGSPLKGLPPTYSMDFCSEDKKFSVNVTKDRLGKVMMIYPSNVALSYIELFDATGEKRYMDAAMDIAIFYKENVLPNGSWYLFLSDETGKPEIENYCVPNKIINFMSKMYEITGDKVWKNLEEGCFKYLEKNCIQGYNFEGQFEDTCFSNNYANLTHFAAVDIAKHIAKTKSDDAKAVETAVTLMRFVEDQFVIWGEFAPWCRNYEYNEYWESPAGLEQYEWYLPIDGSTAGIMSGFMAMYELTGDELWREKAYALADKITRMQNSDTGLIPTQWVTKNANTDIWSFWINCHLGTARFMYELGK